MNGDIVLERDTANDESALVSAVFVQSGTAVAKDDLVFEIENSKAAEEYYAPSAGILLHDLVAGQTVHFGVAIARVVAPDSAEKIPDAASPITAPEPVVTAPVQVPLPVTPVTVDRSGVAAEGGLAAPETQPSAPRFSQAARVLLQTYGVDSSRLDAEFVTAKDVQAHVDGLQTPVPGAPGIEHRNGVRAASAPASSVVTHGAELAFAGKTSVGHRKRAEIQTLSQGAGASMLSVLGVTLGPVSVRREPGDFLAGRITDLVLYEASRLMRKYPRLNAFYADHEIIQHDAVHAGLAIDEGGRLMVYGVEDADKKEIRELGEIISDAVARYMDHKLTGAELNRATFTVTDLSDGELDFVFPLLPQGQSCILGITFSAQGGFRIFAGFDHRVTDGREVTAFLGELRERVLSFSSESQRVVSADVCEYCGRSVREAITLRKEKGLLRVIGRDGRDTLCCGSCWDGW